MSEAERQRIRKMFMEVAALPLMERAAALNKLCEGSPALRIEVERLLQADADAGGFMANPTNSFVGVPAGPDNRTTSDAVITERPGEVIGPYKLLQIIGEGGFGTVYMAEQQRPIVRKVALKIIKLGMDTRQVVARFEQERQALALMDHPNIAKVLDGGATDSGRPYFVMELVKGITITEYCDKNNLSARERLELFIPVCQAVQHAHHKGVIHRDIKPSNILVTLHDGKPVPKVIDFGVAKATNARLTEKTLFTDHHQFIGTPAYMSPEQAELSGLDIDTRADVYALGVLLYELLTGTTPFETAELLKAGYAEIQRIIREVEPPKPSTRVATLGGSLAATASRRNIEPARLGLLLKGDLDWIVMKALEKDRQRRYDTPIDMSQDVLRHLTGEAVLAAPPSRAYRVRKYIKRNKGKVVAGSAITAALLLGVAGTSWQWWRVQLAIEGLRAERQIAIDAFESVVEEGTSGIDAMNAGVPLNPVVRGQPDFKVVPAWSRTTGPDGSYSSGETTFELLKQRIDQADAGRSYTEEELRKEFYLQESEVLPALADLAVNIVRFSIEARKELEAANSELRVTLDYLELANARGMVSEADKYNVWFYTEAASQLVDDNLSNESLLAAVEMLSSQLGDASYEVARARLVQWYYVYDIGYGEYGSLEDAIAAEGVCEEVLEEGDPLLLEAFETMLKGLSE